jgi:hypothetical protein
MIHASMDRRSRYGGDAESVWAAPVFTAETRHAARITRGRERMIQNNAFATESAHWRTALP